MQLESSSHAQKRRSKATSAELLWQAHTPLGAAFVAGTEAGVFVFSNAFFGLFRRGTRDGDAVWSECLLDKFKEGTS